jgi:hypothetical protein
VYSNFCFCVQGCLAKKHESRSPPDYIKEEKVSLSYVLVRSLKTAHELLCRRESETRGEIWGGKRQVYQCSGREQWQG